MKSKMLCVALLAIFAMSCGNEAENLFVDAQSITSQSRSVNELDVVGDSLVEARVPEDMLQMKDILEQLTPKKIKSPLSSYNPDQWFSSNIYAIRELPVTISVRGVASGSTASRKYLSCIGKGEEVTLSSYSTNPSSKFYIKVLPATTGIPYLIYSNLANTPLTIGHWSQTPNTKILMSQKDNSKLFDFAGWDLHASPTYKGYFAIQNNSYLGQADPNNSWSIFYYVLEAIANDKLGFAKPVSGKAQQEFLITPCDKFTISSIEYDMESARTTPMTKSCYGTGQNISTQEKEVDVNFNFTVSERSYFNTYNNTLKVNIKDSNVITPWVTANHVMLPGTDSDREHIQVPFQTAEPYNTSRQVKYTLKLNCPARHNIKVLAHFVTYNVSIDFVATAYLKTSSGDTREVKISGTWSGVVFEDPREVKPKYDDPTFTSMGGGTDIPIIIPDKGKFEILPGEDDFVDVVKP